MALSIGRGGKKKRPRHLTPGAAVME